MKFISKMLNFTRNNRKKSFLLFQSGYLKLLAILLLIYLSCTINIIYQSYLSPSQLFYHSEKISIYDPDSMEFSIYSRKPLHYSFLLQPIRQFVQILPVSVRQQLQQQMYNAYKNDKPPTDKSQLRILDYRNGKYQGTTVGPRLIRQGVGTVLDHNYLLSIATWKSGNVEGEAFIVFPDCTIFYGILKDQFPVGMGCYQVPGKLQIHSLIGTGQQDLFALDDHSSKTIILLTIPRRIMISILQEPTVYEKVLKQESDHMRQTAKLKFQKEVTYKDASEKWSTLESFFKTAFSNESKGYKQFVRHYFNTEVKISQAKIQVSQTGEDVQFNYQNSSITCKISQNFQNPLDFRIKLLGYYNHRDHQFEIVKKNPFKNDIAEEIIEQFKCQYPLKQRPAICMKHTQAYYRKSLHFINDFLEIDYLYRIRFIYHSIEASIGELSINKNAQKQLENPTPAKDKQRQDSEAKTKRLPTIHQQTYSKENLDKMKDDMSKAIKNRSLSHSKSISNSKLQYHYPDKVSVSRVANPSYRPRQDPEPHVRSINYQNTSPGKRSYVYLEEPNERPKNTYESPKKYEYTKELKGRSASKSNGKLTKYKYLDDSIHPHKTENLSTLTNYYREIEDELRKETPKVSQRKHRNIDGYSNSRNGFQQSKEDNYDNRLQKGQERYQNTPLGTKRVFKYGWG